METHFTSDFFVANRRRLRQLFTGTAPIVLTANGMVQRGGDSSFAFAQDANFWYLTGIDEPDIVLVMDKDTEYLIVPLRDSSRSVFDGAIDETALKRRSGVDTVLNEADGWQLLSARLKRAKHVATIAAPPAYLERYGMYTNPARAALIQQLKTQSSSLELLDLTMHVVRLRMVKQAPEIAAIQAAIDITIDTLKTVTKRAPLERYVYEYELEAAITRGFRRRGAAGHAFEPIVAGGSRACTLHNLANAGRFSSDELVILDVGAEVEHYAADISRTAALRTPSRRQEAVLQAVLETQRYAFAHLKPGVFLQSYEAKVEKFIGNKLRELGLIKTVDHDSVRRYYPHAASHFLGLNVHDVGDYDRPLEAGNVLTVEPGIYIPEEGIGVRIEDDVLMTANGIEVLSSRLPGLLL